MFGSCQKGATVVTVSNIFNIHLDFRQQERTESLRQAGRQVVVAGEILHASLSSGRMTQTRTRTHTKQGGLSAALKTPAKEGARVQRG